MRTKKDYFNPEIKIVKIGLSSVLATSGDTFLAFDNDATDGTFIWDN